MDDIRNLPILDRDPLSVLQTQPGVIANGNSYTVINGLRTSYSDITLDGINIQDNYIRDNALDYVPNRLLLGQVRQMTLVTSNGNAASFGGATETAFSTPSGTNQFHGEAYWYNRNNDFSANDWFNNQAGMRAPFLNQNQLGGSIGGPIIKDKLFFYSNYEAVRAHQQEPVTTVILTATARQGIFEYRNSGGALEQVNLLGLRNITIDPAIQTLLNQVPGPQFINTETPATAALANGNVLSPDGLNTGGYRFNQQANEIRDNVTGKLDYNLSTSQALSGSYLWNRDNSRPSRPGKRLLRGAQGLQSHQCQFRGRFLALDPHLPPHQRTARRLQPHLRLLPHRQQFGSYYLTGPGLLRSRQRIPAAGPHHQHLLPFRRRRLAARPPLHPVRLSRPGRARTLL